MSNIRNYPSLGVGVVAVGTGTIRGNRAEREFQVTSSLTKRKKGMFNKLRYALVELIAPSENYNEKNKYPTTDAEIRKSPYSRHFSMRVFPASGGTAIEVSYNDSEGIKDTQYNLHVVRDDADLGEEMSKIITQQSLSI